MTYQFQYMMSLAKLHDKLRIEVYNFGIPAPNVHSKPALYLGKLSTKVFVRYPISAIKVV